jgi:hypothetical protein
MDRLRLDAKNLGKGCLVFEVSEKSFHRNLPI